MSEAGKKGAGITNQKRWGVNLIINNYEVESFDRYEVIAKLSKSGRHIVQKILYIRNNDRERFDQIEQKLRSKNFGWN